MALAEKALKVGGKTFEVAACFKTLSAAHSFFSLQHDLPSNQETADSCPYFCTFEFIFELLIKLFSNHLIIMTIKFLWSAFFSFIFFPVATLCLFRTLRLTASYHKNEWGTKSLNECISFYLFIRLFVMRVTKTCLSPCFVCSGEVCLPWWIWRGVMAAEILEVWWTLSI